jgi:tRNA wybutosine-synthesizing protein 3
LISLPKLGDKPGSVVLDKWHDPIDLEELESALETWDGKNILMLLVQSPVIHVVCRNLTAASKIRNIADGSGFKYSTIRSIHTSEDHTEEQMNITVEILSTERMDIPLGRNGELFPSKEYLKYILELAVACMQRSRGKLERLQVNLESKI